ncbi:MAG: BtpA/SgcQ family protein [Planctomycetota bacterium]
MEKRQASLFDRTRPKVIGVVHLKPLPGSPSYAGDPDRIYDAAAADAEALCQGGADGMIVENFGDAPFFPSRVEPHTVALMTAVMTKLSGSVDIPMGVNVLRNDGMAAIGIALATGAEFVRINVFIGATVTDQGIIEGKAHELLRYRQALGSKSLILADVHVKHGHPLAGGSIEDAAKDAWHRGRADGIIVTGPATGACTDLRDLQAVREAVPDAFLLAGSGVTADTAPAVLRLADAVIVGTSLKINGEVRAPIDPGRVTRLVNLVRAL